MFVVFLRLRASKERAAQHLNGHSAWIQRGFDDRVFLVVGSISAAGGGAILAHNTTLEELKTRISQDPFVANDIVRPEIVEFSASRADERLSFVLA
jgi:uncharacterized protein YciI